MALITFRELEDHIGLITLNDPETLNAMGPEMALEMRNLVAVLEPKRRNYRALILTGAGRAFSAGGHLDMLEKKKELSGEENRIRMLEFYNSFLCLRDLEIPLIAALNGHAIGAGLCVACACDLRVASENAKLGFTFTRLGLHPGMAATWFLPIVIGRAAAAELMLTGRVITAARAQELGMLSSIVDEAKVLDAAIELAGEIGQCGPEATRQLLKSLRVPATTLEAAIEREALCQSINYKGAEFAEGVRAAIEKRKANYVLSK